MTSTGDLSKWAVRSAVAGKVLLWLGAIILAWAPANLCGPGGCVHDYLLSAFILALALSLIKGRWAALALVLLSVSLFQAYRDHQAGMVFAERKARIKMHLERMEADESAATQPGMPSP